MSEINLGQATGRDGTGALYWRIEGGRLGPSYVQLFTPEHGQCLCPRNYKYKPDPVYIITNERGQTIKGLRCEGGGHITPINEIQNCINTSRDPAALFSGPIPSSLFQVNVPGIARTMSGVGADGLPFGPPRQGSHSTSQDQTWGRDSTGRLVSGMSHSGAQLQQVTGAQQHQQQLSDAHNQSVAGLQAVHTQAQTTPTTTFRCT